MSDAPTCEQCGSVMTADRLGGKAVGWHCAACRDKRTAGVLRRIGRAASKAARLSKSQSP